MEIIERLYKMNEILGKINKNITAALRAPNSYYTRVLLVGEISKMFYDYINILLDIASAESAREDDRK